MALILDTRFLVAHAFPPTAEDRGAILSFAKLLAREQLLIPAVVVAEFIKVAGLRVGADAARARVRAWLAAGAGVAEVSYEDAEEAGLLLLRHQGVPVADALIAAIARRRGARVVSDDPHFRQLGVVTVWYK